MTQLDRDGLTYLLTVIKEMGFDIRKLETCESLTERPCIKLDLVQVRDVDPQTKQDKPDLRRGVTEEQARAIAEEGKKLLAKSTLIDGTVME